MRLCLNRHLLTLNVEFISEQVTVPVVGMMSGTVFAASEAKQKNDTLMIDEVCLNSLTETQQTKSMIFDK